MAYPKVAAMGADVSQYEYSEKKFKELMLYVAARMEADPSFGATKLNKVLFFSDMFHYAIHGEPITGATYQRLQWGPAPRRLLPARQELILEGSAALKTTLYLGARQQRLVPLREAELHMFSATELELVDDIIRLVWNHGATRVSEMSHEFVGWKLAETNEEIPYETVYLTAPRELTREQIAQGELLARDLGLSSAA